MDTDVFFDEYSRRIRHIEKSFIYKKVYDKPKTLLAIESIFSLCVSLLLIFLNRWWLVSGLLLSLSLLIGLYLDRIDRSESVYNVIKENKCRLQHVRYTVIKDLLTEYSINDDESIDMLIECLKDNQEKYKYGNKLYKATKSVVSFISVVLSLSIVDFFILKVADLSAESITDWIVKNGSNILIFTVEILVLILEFCYIWQAIIYPKILNKYFYHEEIVRDLKAYKVFKNYHEYMNFDLSESIRKENKLTKIIKQLFAKKVGV